MNDIKFYYSKGGVGAILDFGLWAIVLYRIGRKLRDMGYRKINPIWYIYVMMYQLQLFFLKIELPSTVKIGKNLFLPHPYGLVMAGKTYIGNNVTIGPWVVIGHNFDGGNPTIEDNCYIGPKATVIGGITVGNSTVVGVGAMLTKSTQPHSLVKPAKSEIVENYKQKEVNARK